MGQTTMIVHHVMKASNATHHLANVNAKKATSMMAQMFFVALVTIRVTNVLVPLHHAPHVDPEMIER
jgi:hypothetical protein